MMNPCTVITRIRSFYNTAQHLFLTYTKPVKQIVEPLMFINAGE